MTPAKKILASLLLLVSLSTFSFLRPSPARAQDTGGEALAFFCGDPFLAIVRIVDSKLVDFLSADHVWYNQSFCQFVNRVFDENNTNEIFGERYTYAQINWIYSSVTAWAINGLFGFTNINSIFQGLLGSAPLTPPAQASVFGFMVNSFPTFQSVGGLSFIGSLQGFLSRFDLAAPVHAQGYGFATLTGLQNLWTASRNMTYFLMVIVLVAAGFLIMFRVKINPQTAVTLQLMIPRIVITLLLITFSYAIAGLVIDLLYVLFGLIISLLPDALLTNPANRSATIDFFTRPDFNHLYLYYSALSAWAAISLGGPLGPLGMLIIPILIIFLLFRVWWMMLKTYLMLIIQVIIAPWQILLGLIPGQGGFGSWFKSYIASASVFLVVPLMFMLTIFFWMDPANPIIIVINALAATIGASPGLNGIPISNLPQLPLWGNSGQFGSNFLRLSMGFGLLAMMPKVADMIKEALKVKSDFGTGIGVALGPVVAVGRPAAGFAAERALGGTATALGGAGGIKGAIGKGAGWLNQYGQAQKWWVKTP